MQILEVLKESTREAHLRLERVVPLSRTGLTREGYRAYLARLLGFYAPVEGALAAQDWASLGFDYEPRRKVPLLHADLAALGLGDAEREALPTCRLVPSLPALPEALGCAYVFEGATRGGRVLARLYGETLGVTREQGGAFFLAYGEDGDAMWLAFRALLVANLSDERSIARALAAALQTFALLHRWIEEGEVDRDTTPSA